MADNTDIVRWALLPKSEALLHVPTNLKDARSDKMFRRAHSGSIAYAIMLSGFLDAVDTMLAQGVGLPTDLVLIRNIVGNNEYWWYTFPRMYADESEDTLHCLLSVMEAVIVLAADGQWEGREPTLEITANERRILAMIISYSEVFSRKKIFDYPRLPPHTLGLKTNLNAKEFATTAWICGYSSDFYTNEEATALKARTACLVDTAEADRMGSLLHTSRFRCLENACDMFQRELRRVAWGVSEDSKKWQDWAAKVLERSHSWNIKDALVQARVTNKKDLLLCWPVLNARQRVWSSIVDGLPDTTQKPRPRIADSVIWMMCCLMMPDALASVSASLRDDAWNLRCRAERTTKSAEGSICLKMAAEMEEYAGIWRRACITKASGSHSAKEVSDAWLMANGPGDFPGIDRYSTRISVIPPWSNAVTARTEIKIGEERFEGSARSVTSSENYDEALTKTALLAFIAAHDENGILLDESEIKIELERHEKLTVLPPRKVCVLSAIGGTVTDSKWGKLQAEYSPLIDGVSITAGTSTAEKAWKYMNNTFPWMREANLLVARAAEAAHKGGQGTLGPLLLVGPPGIGKTRWAREAAEALGLPFQSASMAGVNTSMVINGSERGYSNAQAGIVARCMLEHYAADPLILLDEVDKIGTGTANGNVADAILPLLEKETSARLRDLFLLSDVDASHISWVLTANLEHEVPSPLLSRLHIVRVQPPPPEMVDPIINRMQKEAKEKRGMEADVVFMSEVERDDLKRNYVKYRNLRWIEREIGKFADRMLWLPPDEREEPTETQEPLDAVVITMPQRRPCDETSS